MKSKGIFILDIEVELAWGLIDKETNWEKIRSASEKVRHHLDVLLDLLDKYEIPSTWGILGHLILDNCKRISGLPHPEMPRPSYRWMKSDWYKNDPCKTISDEPAFYGKDIVDRIVEYTLNSKTSQDIACHSFSHQLFGDPGCTEAVAEAEIMRCLSLMRENYGIKPKVFIFPRDYPGCLNVLHRNGFIAFRGRIPHIVDYSETGGGILNSIGKYISLTSYLGSFYLRVPPPVVSLGKENGLVNIPGSMCYNKKPFIPLDLIVLKAMKGIERAIKEQKIFHLYTHLINFGAAPDVKTFLGGFEKILSYANVCREKNELGITAMKELAEDYLIRNRTISYEGLRRKEKCET